MKNTRTIQSVVAALLLSGCSMSNMVVSGSLSVMDGGVEAMNRETDLELARTAIPANLKLVEGLIIEAPDNLDLRLNAAQGFYGFAYGFVEDEDRQRASALYRRCLAHGLTALSVRGIDIQTQHDAPAVVEQKTARAGEKEIAALFWTSACWAKWIDMNRDDPAAVAQLGSTAALMQRVLELDERFYYGGPHVFFAVYYGGRATMFGGDMQKSAQHFERARQITDGKLLIVDVLRAQFLDQQQLDQESFHNRLAMVVSAPPDLFPEMALANAVAQRKARELLSRENRLF